MTRIRATTVLLFSLLAQIPSKLFSVDFCSSGAGLETAWPLVLVLVRGAIVGRTSVLLVRRFLYLYLVSGRLLPVHSDVPECQLRYCTTRSQGTVLGFREHSIDLLLNRFYVQDIWYS